jgi:hypothetical protein
MHKGVLFGLIIAILNTSFFGMSDNPAKQFVFAERILNTSTSMAVPDSIYQNSTFGFKIRYPSDWVLSSTEQFPFSGNTTFGFIEMHPNSTGLLGPSGIPASVHILVNYLPNRFMGLNEAVRNFPTQNFWIPHEEILSESPVTIGGKPAAKQEWLNPSFSDSPVKGISIYTINGELLYEIAYYSNTLEDFAVYLSAAQKIVESFEPVNLSSPASLATSNEAYTPDVCGPGNNTETDNANMTNTVSGFLTYVNTGCKIEVQYPSDWIKDEIPDSVTFTAPIEEDFGKGDPLADNLFIMFEASNHTSLHKYVTDRVKEEKLLFGPDFKQLESNYNTSVSGYPAYQISYLTPSGYDPATNESMGPPIKVSEIVTAVDDIIYSIVYTADLEDYSKHLPTVERIIDSIKIKSETYAQEASVQNNTANSGLPADIPEECYIYGLTQFFGKSCETGEGIPIS